MWFKRKKKSDPDSALTDSLRSLQTLLSENTSGRRVEPNVSTRHPADDNGLLIQDTDATPVLTPEPEEDGIPVLVDNVDLTPSLRPGVRMNLPTRDLGEETVEDHEAEVVDEVTDEYTEYNLGPLGTSDDDGSERSDMDDTPTFDNIPILNEVVSTSRKPEPVKPSEEEISAKEALIEAAVRDFEFRLQNGKLPPLSEQEKQKLRQTLALLVVTRNKINPD